MEKTNYIINNTTTNNIRISPVTRKKTTHETTQLHHNVITLQLFTHPQNSH